MVAELSVAGAGSAGLLISGQKGSYLGGGCLRYLHQVGHPAGLLLELTRRSTPNSLSRGPHSVLRLGVTSFDAAVCSLNFYRRPVRDCVTHTAEMAQKARIRKTNKMNEPLAGSAALQQHQQTWLRVDR